MLDGSQPFALTISVDSSDPNYGPRRDGTGGIRVPNQLLENLDSDKPGRTIYGTPGNNVIVPGDDIDSSTVIDWVVVVSFS